MHTKSRITVGVALAGAGAIALAPLTPAAHDVAIDAAKTPSVTLTAATDPIRALIADVAAQVETGGATRVNDPNAVALADAPGHIAAGLAAAGIRTTQSVVMSPLQLAALASAIATGDQQKAAAAIVNAIDAPLWAADPALLSLWDAAPAPIGGAGAYEGLVWNLRETWRHAGIDLEGLILGARNPSTAATATGPIQGFITDVAAQVDTSGATRVNNPAAVALADAPGHIAAGLAASGIRTAQSVIGSPLQLISLASAIANGDQVKASAAIVNTIDGPLWAADPALLSVWESAPAPIGGEGSSDGLVWNARESVRNTGNTVERTVLDAAGLPKPAKLNDAGAASSTLSSGARTVTLSVPAAQAPDKRSNGNLFKPNTTANDTAAQSGQKANGAFSGIRDSISKTATKVAGSVSGKNAEK